MFGMLRTALLSAMLAACTTYSCAAMGQQWRELGPAGGPLRHVAAGAAGTGQLYAMGVGRIFASEDSGVSWHERLMPPACRNPSSGSTAIPALEARADGNVFVHCNAPIMRSVDGARRWSAFTPGLLDGQLAFNPVDPRRVAVRRWLDEPWLVAYTDDDALTWSVPRTQFGDPFVPWFIAWDPLQPDRLVGVGTPTVVASPSENALGFYESFDWGARWSRASVVMQQSPTAPCYEREFLVQADHAYILADCGLFRSLDRGRTWQLTNPFPGSRPMALRAGRAAGGLLVIAGDRLHESRDAAGSWQPLPAAPARVNDYAVSAGGELFAATTDGIYLLDDAKGAWTSRSDGLHAKPLRAVEPAGGENVRLLAVSADNLASNVQSADGGTTWTAGVIAGITADGFARNLTVPAYVYATSGRNLFASSDAGMTWTLVNANLATAPDDQIVGIVSTGPQPGVVYGLWQTCDVSAFGGCFFNPHGVVRSEDGGRTWARTAAMSTPAYVFRVVVSPTNADTAMAEASDGLWLTQDGGKRWTRRTPAYARVTADAHDASRWYAVDGNSLSVTTDAGVHWQALANPSTPASGFSLLVDPRIADRLYVIGAAGDVSISNDRGSSWYNIVAPSLHLTLAPASARIGPEAITTLYAAGAQGAVKLAVAAIAPVVVDAVEFHRGDLDHYFVTADGSEIEKLDSGVIAGWSRTGETFKALATIDPSSVDVAPVCRFYGRPERGLDSHFYSASRDECQAVRDRFADAWIFESPSVFGVYLPDPVHGACPERTLALYRLFNNRADANHRYTTSSGVRQQMIAAGWISEGYGPQGVAMCVPK